MKKRISILMTFMLLAALFVPAASYGATFSDIKGHWAESYINEAVQEGVVQGYPDGTFLPDKSVTRAEFAAMVNKALRNTATSSISFTDVPHNEWFYSDISKAVAATYVAGYENNTFLPNAPITRQEAAVVISRIVPSYGISGNLNSYKDSTNIANWAYTAFQKVNGKKYIGAYNDGNLHPLDNLTRAQTAKIICDILNNERIVTTDPVVQSNNTTLSNTIYSNGVTIHRNLNNGNATIENCIILGNLSVQGGGDNSVTVSNSRVAQGMVEKSASSVRFIVRGESVISTLTAARTATIQTSNLSGGLYGSGINNLNTSSSSDIKLQGSFPKVNINGSNSKLTLASGSITNMVVSGNARQSSITVDSGASISTVDVNAESSFHGTGTISRMNVYANNVTYETKPIVINVGSQYKPPEEIDGDSAVKFSPVSGATRVKLDAKVTITFNSAMKLYSDGGTITNSDIYDFITIHEGSSNGWEVDYSASINSAKTIITLTPEYDLEEDTKYYVALKKNAFIDRDGDGNQARTISFSTGTDSDDSFTTYSPKRGATGVSTNINPTITFDEALYTNSGGNINSSYLTSSVIIFREENSSGTRVPFEATINNAKRVITIKPDNTLKEGQRYYLEVASNKFRTQSGNKTVTGSSVTWTTTGSSNTGYTFSPGNNNTGVSTGIRPTITFDNAIVTYAGGTVNSSYLTNNSSIIFKRDSSSGSNVPFNATINNDRVITITPTAALTEGQRYYLGIASNKFKTKSGNRTIPSGNVTWTVATTSTDSVYSPLNGAAGVSVGTKPTITFSSAIATSTGGTVDSAYLASSLVFKKDSASGSDIPFMATIDSAKVITINPTTALSEGQKYYLSVVANKFRTQTGNQMIPSSNVTWTTVGAQLSDITSTVTDTSASITAKANMAGTVYAVLVEGSSAPSANQIINGQDSSGNSATYKNSQSVAANGSATFTFAGLKKGTQYTCYMVLRSGSSNSSVASRTVTTTKTYAQLSSITVSNGTLSPTFNASTTRYTVAIPATAPKNAITISASAVNGVIKFKEGANDFTTANNIQVTPDYGSDKIVQIQIEQDNKETQTYTITVKVAGDTTLSSVIVNGKSATLNGSTYSATIDTESTAAEIKITATDPKATITYNSSSNIGSFTISLDNIYSKPYSLKFTVKSSTDVKEYTLVIN